MKRIAVVTGGNRGIGLSIAHRLGRAGLSVVVGSRDLVQGQAAAQELCSAGFDAEAAELDVEKPESITRFAAQLVAHKGGVDVLVNNAGASFDGFNETVARRTVDVNFYGAKRLTDALLPALRAEGRVVMVSSGMGEVSCLSPALAARFMNPALSRDELCGLVEEFVVDVAAGRHTAAGWPTSAYRVSKVAMNALTRILAAELASDPRHILVNATCPGWVRTRMGGQGAPRTTDEGAATPAWLALLPHDGPSGGFFRDEARIPW